METSKFEYRAVIKFLTHDGCLAISIHVRLVKCWGDHGPSRTTVERWMPLFKRGRVSLDDNPVTGRPKSATDEETVLKVQDVLNTDQRIKLREIVKDVGISESCVRTLLTPILVLENLVSVGCLSFLHDSIEQIGSSIVHENLDFMKGEGNFFVTQMSGDETWCYYYELETKVQSKNGSGRGSQCP